MKGEKKDVIEPQNWVPWIGLALVVPALVIMLVGFAGAFLGMQRTSTGRMMVSADSGSIGLIAGVAVTGAVIGIMLAAVGIVRGLRRKAPHTGRSVGIAGFSLEIAVLAIGLAALVILGLAIL
jgi:hypothetical protein